MTPLAMLLAVLANSCGVTWDPVEVLPTEVRRTLANAKVVSPCRVASLPAAVREHLAEAVGAKKIIMADPDQRWNDGCLRSEDVPSRQLIAAATVGSRWVVHYREGGFAVAEWVAVLEVDKGVVRPLWHGVCFDEAAAPRPADVVARLARTCKPTQH